MKVIREMLALDELKPMAATLFGDLVKAVVDVEREILVVDAELQSNLDAVLLRIRQ